MLKHAFTAFALTVAITGSALAAPSPIARSTPQQPTAPDTSYANLLVPVTPQTAQTNQLQCYVYAYAYDPNRLPSTTAIIDEAKRDSSFWQQNNWR